MPPDKLIAEGALPSEPDALGDDERSPKLQLVARSRKAGLLTTGDMARLSSSTVRTVRFYEETGVLQPAHRSEGGHRLFPTDELDKLLFVLDMRNAGLSLEEIKSVIGLKQSAPCGATASERVIDALATHIDAMTAKIDALSRLRDDFTRAAKILGACRRCNDDPKFPAGCGACPVMGDRHDPLPLAVRVLWSVNGDEQPSPSPAPGRTDDEEP